MASPRSASARVGAGGWITLLVLTAVALLAGWQPASVWAETGVATLTTAPGWEWMPEANVPTPVAPLRAGPVGEPTLPVWIVDLVGVLVMLVVALAWLRAAGMRHPFPGRGRAFWRAFFVTVTALAAAGAVRSIGMSLIVPAGWDVSMTALLGTVVVSAAMGAVLGVLVGALAALASRPEPPRRQSPRRAGRQPDPFRELGLR
ncbi:MAG: hypothetical protein ACK5IN_06510 [Microbacterium sp.]|uniref:hypothetical protein n=1 Tax=Microbacterium sp. TaxID=51671 RepID=UPI003A8BFB2A